MTTVGVEASPDLPEAFTFRTGTNEWVRHDVWPPKQNVAARDLYFREGGKLSFEAPGAKEESDSYVSDPANPVPYRPRPIDFSSGWTTWLVEDQRFVDHRPTQLSTAACTPWRSAASQIDSQPVRQSASCMPGSLPKRPFTGS